MDDLTCHRRTNLTVKVKIDKNVKIGSNTLLPSFKKVLNRAFWQKNRDVSKIWTTGISLKNQIFEISLFLICSRKYNRKGAHWDKVFQPRNLWNRIKINGSLFYSHVLPVGSDWVSIFLIQIWWKGQFCDPSLSNRYAIHPLAIAPKLLLYFLVPSSF